MRTCYVDTEHRAIVDLVAPGELTPDWTLTRINVPARSRGNGVGSRLLDRVLADADAEGATIRLEVQPSGDLDYDALTAWYGRRGFVLGRYGYLVRRPR